jgi:hypothetical protein
VSAQQPVPPAPQSTRAKKLPRQHLSGPRFGFTVFTGDVADKRDRAGLEPIMTQFGWQFETRIMSTQGGNQALMEWVVLVGGVEQDEFNLGVSWLAGYRMENGVEFGVGPNISFNKDSDEPTTSMIVAGGVTLPFGDLYVPLNMAVSIAEGGPRFTTLLGWIVD